MKKISPRELYLLGESFAVTYLINKGYIVLDTNYSCPQGEIDVVAQRENCLVFVEVKTRRKHSITEAKSSISHTKQKRLSITAQYYINQNPQSDNLNTRFDALILFYNDIENSFTIHHLENAFYPIIDSNY